MAQKKKSILPRFEILIIVVFFLSFVLWAFKQCSTTMVELEKEKAELEAAEKDTVAVIPPPTRVDTIPSLAVPTPAPAITAPQEPALSRLYVTIDGLKLREAPNLNSEVITQLKLFEEVGYMNEYTDSTYQISLGYEIVEEPWIKVKHKGGRVGWVFGAGVDYRKKKRQGVLE